MVHRHVFSTLAILSLAAQAVTAQIDAPLARGPEGVGTYDLLVRPSDPLEILLSRWVPSGHPGSNLLRSLDGGATFVPPVGPDEGLRELAHDARDPDWIYGLNSASELVHSTDFGLTWSKPTPGIDEVDVWAVAPNGSDLIAHGSSGSASFLERSIDGGSTWAPIPTALPQTQPVQLVEYAPSAADVVYMFARSSPGNYHVYRSGDGGTTFPVVWDWPYSSATGIRMAVHPTLSDVVMLAHPTLFEQLWLSTDGGQSFDVLPTSTFFQATSVQWDPGGSHLWLLSPSSSWYSANTGSSWTQVPFESSAESSFESPGPMTHDSLGNRYLHGGSSTSNVRGVQRMDAGLPGTWGHPGTIGGLPVEELLLLPGADRLAWIPGRGLHLAAFGESFLPLGADVRAEAGLAINALDPTVWVAVEEVPDPSCEYPWLPCFSYDLVTRLYGAGGTQSFVSSESAAPSGGAPLTATFAFDPSDASSVIRVVHSPAGPATNAAAFSIDGGLSWTAALSGPLGLLPGERGCVAFDPDTPGRALLLGELPETAPVPHLALCETLDGGRTWSAPTNLWPLTEGPSAAAQAALVVFDPNYAGILFVGDTELGLQVSDDGGGSWSPLGVDLSGVSELVAHPGLPGLLWVSDADGEVLASADYGASFAPAWPEQGGRLAGPLALDTTSGSLLVGTLASSVWELPHASSTVKLGTGTAGSGGFVPRHFPYGGFSTIGNTGFLLAGDRVPGGALVLPVLGFDSLPFPAYGGTWYVDLFTHPWVLFPAVAAGGTPGAAGAGSFAAPLPIPADPSLAGAQIHTQCAVIDAGAVDPSGLTLTNALVSTLLP